MKDLELVKKQTLDELREDYVGLWSIVRSVRDLSVSEPLDIRESTLSLLTQILSEGQIVAGQFGRTKSSRSGFDFNLWKVSPDDAVSKINSEWLNLGRDPTLGEIV